MADARGSRIRCYAGRRCFCRSDSCISGLFRGGVSAQGGSRTVSASFCRRGSGGSNCIMHGRSIRNGFAALARVAAGAGRRSYKRESLFRYDGVFLSVLFRLSYRGGSCSSAVEIFVCNCRRRPGGPMRRDLCDVAGLWGYLRIKIDS